MLLPKIVALLSVAVFAQGCANTSVSDTWKSTKSFYYTYVNTPASINYEDKGILEEPQARLARQMQDVDEQLRGLERQMEALERGPSPADISQLFERFPWISGVQLLSAEGYVLAQEPLMAIKQLDFSPMLELTGVDNNARSLRGYVQDTPLGPEVAVATPVYRDAEFVGLLITHFDMRQLMSYVKDPGDLVVLSSESVLWAGRFNFESTPLASVNWKSVLNSSTGGQESNKDGQFLWTSRFLGGMPLVFSVPAQGIFAESAAQQAQVQQAAGQKPFFTGGASDFIGGSILLTPAPDMPDSGPESSSIKE